MMKSTRETMTKIRKGKLGSRESLNPPYLRTVVNLYKRWGSLQEVKTLSLHRRPDYASLEDIFANVESEIRYLPSDIAEEIRLKATSRHERNKSLNPHTHLSYSN